MKKAFYIIYAAAFFLICALPVALMPFIGEQENLEKRELAEAPKFVTDDGKINTELPKDTENYIMDRFAFRTELVTAFSVLKAEIFGTSSQEQVVVGKDDWLYFSKTLDDFTGENTLSETELLRVKKVVDLIDEYVQSKNGKFVFMIAPNKNTVYPQNMPYYYVQNNENSNYSVLKELMSDSTYFLDLEKVFLNGDERYYHKRDSHWNNKGANLAYTSISELLDRNYRDYEALGGHYENNWAGDLDAMIFPTLGVLDEQYIYNYDYSFEYLSSFKSADDITIKTTVSPNGSGNLMMYRDSFGNALYPFLAEDFKTATFSRIFPYRLNLLDDACDTVIIEIVERNISNLLSSAPVMKAPERSADCEYTKIDANIIAEKKNGMIHVYGTSEEYGIDDVFIKIVNEQGIKYYEAFPVVEAELLKQNGKKDISDSGFSAYIEYEEGLTYNIEVVCRK